MFSCVCGREAFYEDYMVLLGDTIVTNVDGVKELEILRKIRYYTCVNCDRRWIFSKDKNAFVTDGDV